ncbi:MAG: tetratricopeptide repeat protein [Chlamydiae bacterium]|nr:tetratricopeptide repeat protein [Chlamydiota bacterium]MBI3266247.1 tetratricopeptide repeat protein [Chlamydiota bacterium]
MNKLLKRIRLFFVFFLLTSQGWLAALQDTEGWDSAAYLIKRKEYAPALEVIHKLLEKSPQDPFLLRMKGICLVELNKEDEAILLFREALKIEPESFSCRYHLAQALAYRGDLSESIRLLTDIQKRAPDSLYAQRAREVLPVLERLRQVEGVRKKDRRWNFLLRLSGEYDDNVRGRSRHVEGDDATESYRLIASADIELRIWEQKEGRKPFTWGGGYTFYESFHEEETLEDFDVMSHSPRLFLQRKGRWGDFPYQAFLQGNYHFIRLGGEDFSEEYEASTGLDFQWLDQAVFRPKISIHEKNFETDTDFPERFSRDGLSYEVGAQQCFYLFQNRLVLGPGYFFEWNDVEGNVFRLESHRISGFISLALPWKLRLFSRVEYQSEDYVEFTPDPERLDDVYTCGGGLSRNFWNEKAKVELSYTYVTTSSNYDFAEYERNIYGLSFYWDL